MAVISDLYCDPEALTRAVQPLAWKGHDIMIFQVLDRAELSPDWDESVLLEDLESGQQLEVSPDYLRTTYRDSRAGASGAHEEGRGWQRRAIMCCWPPTSRWTRRCAATSCSARAPDMWMAPWFLLGIAGVALPIWLHRFARQTDQKRPFASLMFLEASTDPPQPAA